MSVKVLVKDRIGRPKKGVQVFVKWKGGTSRATSDGAGLADLRTGKGTIEYIQVDGRNYDLDLYVDRDDFILPVTIDR